MVRNILLVSSLYDAFVLEEDGSLADQLWDQYVEMGLTMAPAVRRVSTGSQAMEVIAREDVDLVLSMSRIADGDPFVLADQVKAASAGLPFVLLVTDPSELRFCPPPHERRAVDRVFLWNNNPEILLAIVKLMEDWANVDHDTSVGSVPVILMVEDSVQYASVFLPAAYTVIMELTRRLIADGLNPLHRQLRTRTRAKVVLAESYEEAVELYHRYQPYLIGVVTDVEYWKGGRLTKDAGFQFAAEVHRDIPDLPVLMQSSEPELNRERAEQSGFAFLDKNSTDLLGRFRQFLSEYMGFGDFVFRMEDGSAVARARNVHEMLEVLQRVPIEPLIWHAQRNHFSHWMMARTEVAIAEALRYRAVAEFKNPEAVRFYIVEVIREVLADKQSDIVAQYSPEYGLARSGFVHLGKGSLGGKGRGIAFLRYLLHRSKLALRYPQVRIDIPPTIVIGAGEFSQFLADNDLHEFGLQCDDTSELNARFLQANMRPELEDALRKFVDEMTAPIAVRSSSLLEDSHLQPFAGLYTTTMLPNNSSVPYHRLEQLLRAVKMVWASTFGPDSKAYFQSTVHRMQEEQMAVVVQQLVGAQHDTHFYPTFSGTAQSYNFYPVSHMRPEDGVAQLALGLGKTVVEGGATVRFCPKYPQVMPQFAHAEDWLRLGQSRFYALRLREPPDTWDIDPDATLEQLDLRAAEEHGVLERIGSVYCYDDGMVRDGLSKPGPRLVTFANILKYGEMPLVELLSDLLETCRDAMGCAVEIEFACELGDYGSKPVFSLLQVRPFIATSEREVVEVTDAHRAGSWCRTFRALGNGTRKNLRDIVYVKRQSFDKARTRQIAEEVGS